MADKLTLKECHESGEFYGALLYASMKLAFYVFGICAFAKYLGV